jgi:hypothetical protein
MKVLDTKQMKMLQAAAVRGRMAVMSLRRVEGPAVGPQGLGAHHSQDAAGAGADPRHPRMQLLAMHMAPLVSLTATHLHQVCML